MLTTTPLFPTSMMESPPPKQPEVEFSPPKMREGKTHLGDEIHFLKWEVNLALLRHHPTLFLGGEVVSQIDVRGCVAEERTVPIPESQRDLAVTKWGQQGGRALTNTRRFRGVRS